MYIADTGNCVIREVFKATNFIYTIAGDNSKGCGYSGDGGAADSAQHYYPSGVAVNGSSVYVADNGNNVIRLLTPVTQTPVINAGGVVNDASYSAPVAPGSIAAVFGDFFLASSSTSPSVPLSTSLQTLSFAFGSTAAPLYFVSGGQVNMQIPWGMAGQTSASLTTTERNCEHGAGGDHRPVRSGHLLHQLAGHRTGRDPGFQHNLVDAGWSTTAGTTVILIYCTGLGPVSNPPATGAAAPASGATSDTTNPVTVTIGGVTEPAQFAGLAPGYVGLYQVNAQVPAGVTSGPSVNVTITVGSVTSNTVTIPVQ